MKKSLIIILAVSVIGFTSCVKDLLKEGVCETTTLIGRVIEESTQVPVADVMVSVTNGSRTYVSCTTEEDGNFGLEVNFDKIDKDYYLLLDGGFDDKRAKFDLKGMGQNIYDYKNLSLFNKQDTEELSIRTSEITSVMSSSAVCGGIITGGSDANVTARGVCWSTIQNPTINNDHTIDGLGMGSFVSNIMGLDENTTYYVRAYAQCNSEVVTYGEEYSFTTPFLILTSDVKQITANGAACGGIVNAGIDLTVKNRGVCWSKNTMPTILDEHSSDGFGVGEFDSNIIDLEALTLYYVRAYVVIDDTIKYGMQKEFTTAKDFPSIQINGIEYFIYDNILDKMTWRNAMTYCENLSDGGYDDWFLPDKDELNVLYIKREEIGGFTGDGYWSSTQTTNAFYGYLGARMQYFSSGTQWSSYFKDGEKYKVRPVRNGVNKPSVPVIDTRPEWMSGELNQQTFQLIGWEVNSLITSNGGSIVYETGLCWGKSPYPTISGNHCKNTSYDGGQYIDFTCYVYNLEAGVKYYVRPYAINGIGVGYGEQTVW